MQICRSAVADSTHLGEKTNSIHDIIFPTVRHGRHEISQMVYKYIKNKTKQKHSNIRRCIQKAVFF